MKKCQRCNTEYEHGLRWTYESKVEKVEINLCGNCCGFFIVLAMRIHAVDKIDLQLFTNKKTDEVMQRHLNGMKPPTDIE